MAGRQHREWAAWGGLFLWSLSVTYLQAFQHSRPLSCFAEQAGDDLALPGVRLQPTTEFNRRFLLEEQEWQRRLKVTAKLYVIPADNAYAEPSGNVLLGQQLADRYVNSKGEAYAFQALGYIAAHEYGHQFQFRMSNRPVPAGPKSELQADVIAGYWIGMRLAEQVSAGASPEEAYGIMSQDEDAARDIGDYLFGSPEHHGTPRQRHSAVNEGIKAGYARRLGSDFRTLSDATRLYKETQVIVDQLFI
jgi:hypothetical protein